MVWVVFYTSRSSTGEPDQQWGDPDNPVYLKDHWHISWSKDEAVKAHQDILEHHDVHVSGIAPIDPDYHSDWSDAEDEKPEIVRCENSVGEWEIFPLHDTFDTREQAEQALKELVLGDVQHKRLRRDVRDMLSAYLGDVDYWCKTHDPEGINSVTAGTESFSTMEQAEAYRDRIAAVLGELNNE